MLVHSSPDFVCRSFQTSKCSNRKYSWKWETKWTLHASVVSPSEEEPLKRERARGMYLWQNSSGPKRNVSQTWVNWPLWPESPSPMTAPVRFGMNFRFGMNSSSSQLLDLLLALRLGHFFFPFTYFKATHKKNLFNCPSISNPTTYLHPTKNPKPCHSSNLIVVVCRRQGALL